MIEQLPGHPGAIWEYANKPTGLVLDIGGGGHVLPQATHVVDFIKPDNNAQWVQTDINDLSWAANFPDKFFDWVWCNHTLEDIYNPASVLREAVRVAKAGMFGTPHWTAELSIMDVRNDWEHICGWPHHYWLVGINKHNGSYEFYSKRSWIVADDSYEKTMNNLNIVWDGGEFNYKDITYEYPHEMRRAPLVKWLEERWLK